LADSGELKKPTTDADGEFKGLITVDSRLTTVGESKLCSELSRVSMALDWRVSIDPLDARLDLILRKF